MPSLFQTDSYAVAVFHDEKGDGKINSIFLGIPKEGVGVSNNAKGGFGPPRFDDAQFSFTSPAQTITISLTYFWYPLQPIIQLAMTNI